VDRHTDKTNHDYGHVHGTFDQAIMTTERGIWALKWSLWRLLATAFFQWSIVLLSCSVALLADTIHNFSDAAITIPLWIAFRISSRPPTTRFTCGYGRAEELAGSVVVVPIFGGSWPR
jgi:divalent metal cation (Fe/Co/Zn/Cd) transporter